MARWVVGVVVVAAAVGAFLLARRLLLVVRIDGASMEPTFRPGQAVLAVRRAPWRPVRRDDIVVCRLPDGIPGPPGLLIKRVAGVAGDRVAADVVAPGLVYVRGDGPVSYDSRQFGPIPEGAIVGHVVARLASR